MERVPILIDRKTEPTVVDPYGYVYVTTNIVTGKKYVGMHEGKKHDLKYFGSGTYLLKAIGKYGIENFSSCATQGIAIKETNNKLNAKFLNIFISYNFL